MTVRRSDEATAHIHALVREQAFDSRAAHLGWLVEREAQRLRAWHDVQRLRAAGTLHDPELAAVARATSGRPLTHLD